ncbi:DUF814 domain-containing protein [Salidesulfovibrio brasiliensis]|uniref:DUF814 domain-containing protein n=1 Tax=Salidesulfovibrio brasiliensis TaxID=221711 RepID=UPI0006D1E974|nr:DUF814 domain-containing protein [Salidesulfovibrio brasiliensis]
MTKQYDALALLSGGLDSLLAIKVVQDQGLKVLGLHFTTPFFGKPWLHDEWLQEYGIESVNVDISKDYVRMMVDGPDHGFGKWLNPCVDCKVMMLSKAKSLLPEYGAKFIISGEVIGQRPMSQRRDALSIIVKSADVKDVLLRPLSAKNLKATAVEENGLVDRERLLDFKGRSRKPQLALAEHYGFTKIPSPAGGCVLAESESSARFIRLMQAKKQPTPADFRLSQTGRQCWAGPLWLAMGRKQADNKKLEKALRKGDYLMKTAEFPGPLAILRPTDNGTPGPEDVADAAAYTASYSTKARKHFEATGEPVAVTVLHRTEAGDEQGELNVLPSRVTPLGWQEPEPQEVKDWKAEQNGQATA